MTTKKDYVKGIIESLDTKYITVTKAPSFWVRVKLNLGDGTRKEVSETIPISQPLSEKSVLAGLDVAQARRNEIYFEHYGKDLPVCIEKANKLGATIIHSDSRDNSKSQTGYKNVYINISPQHEDSYFCGYLALIRLANKEASPKRKLFNFARARNEGEAFILACKTVDSWLDCTWKSDEEYLELKKEIKWEEKINQLKSH